MPRKPTYIFFFITLFSCFLLGIIITITIKFPYLLIPGTEVKNLNEILNAQNHRKHILKTECAQHNLSKPLYKIKAAVAKQLYVEEHHKLIYCEVPKVGCSNWKRILFLLNINLNVDAEYIDHEAVHENALFKRLIDYPPDQQSILLETYTKVLFTRDPLQRLVSAYRDKFLHYGGYYYGTQIANVIKSQYRKNNKSSESVSFQEFVNFIIDRNAEKLDTHWRPMHYLCDPCNVNYSILGKFETLKVDSDYVLKVVGAPPFLKYPDIKKYNESRTDSKISAKYFAQLPGSLLQKLLKIYKLDFTLFGYR
ncbi:carbohydrate sulfotransferase 8-like [Pseudophryne corroboree]|uniref:carbohydrate sulfotransferase 8-like n=1 Tax=Pseudophryne corroboree TaxID=495146 RepID=UPI0030817881